MADLGLIENIDGLLKKDLVVIGEVHKVRKAAKLLCRSQLAVTIMFTDGCIEDIELEDITVRSLSEVSTAMWDECIGILAYSDRNECAAMEEKLQKAEGCIAISYETLVIAILAAVIRGDLQNNDVLSTEQMSYYVGSYEFASRWLRSVRWVEESAIPVILHGMPKTGTQAMKASLLNAGVEHTYVHYLNFEQDFSVQFGPYFEGTIGNMGNMLGDSSFIKNQYLKNLKNRPVRIISGVREPVARSLSVLFQGIENWGSYPILALGDGDLLAAIQTFMARQTDAMWQWIDAELRDVWGINIYEYPFDKEKGYTVIKKGLIELFLYKLECSDKLDDALSEFLDLPDGFKFIQVHDRAQGQYAKLYREVKSQLVLPEAVTKDFYDNEHMRYFYTDEEINSFYERWQA